MLLIKKKKKPDKIVSLAKSKLKYVTLKVKMTFLVQPTHQPLKTLGVTKYYFYCKTSYIGTIKNSTTAKGLKTIS